MVDTLLVESVSGRELLFRNGCERSCNDSWTGDIGMKVIKKYKTFSGDDHFRSDAKVIEEKYAPIPMINADSSFVVNSTPLWPISENKQEINRYNPIKNVCTTLPSFIHNNSRQGEEWPAKGNMSGCHAMNHDSRMFLHKSMGGGRKPAVKSLPRCRMMVGFLSPERPHFFSGGAETIDAGGDVPESASASEEAPVMIRKLVNDMIQIGFG